MTAAPVPQPQAYLAAITAHAALFDHVAPLAGARVLVHEAHTGVGFCAVQRARVASALTVVAVVPAGADTTPLARLQATGAGPHLVIDVAHDLVDGVRRHTGRTRPIDRVVQGRFGAEPGGDLALLAPGSVIAVHGLACRDAGCGWWPELLAAGLTLRLIAPGALSEAALARAVADLTSLRQAGAWHEPPPAHGAA
jgi:NADPH:quinone reductase-like Zn-dependent oxidoreductase